MSRVLAEATGLALVANLNRWRYPSQSFPLMKISIQNYLASYLLPYNVNVSLRIH